jgi:hypothetical protein
MKIVSPYLARSIIRATESLAQPGAPPDPLPVAAVAIDDPKSLGERLWRGIGFSLGILPGVVTANVAARAFENAHIVAVQIAPMPKPFHDLAPAGPSPAPTGANPKSSPDLKPAAPDSGSVRAEPLPHPHFDHTYLITTVLFVTQALASEVLKNAGKYLWEKIKEVAWPKNSSGEREEPDHDATIELTVQIGHEKASASLEGASSDAAVEALVSEKPADLYRQIKAKSEVVTPHPAPKRRPRRTRRRTLSGKDVVRIKLRYTPRGSSKSKVEFKEL